MLSLLRTVARRPLLRPSLTANISNGPSSFGDLADVLTSEAERQPTPRKSTRYAVPKEQARRQQDGKWKPFMPNRVVKPHELTYKARFKTPRTPTRRAAVGPAPAYARYKDVFHQFGIDPLSQAQNPAILAEYMSEMGKIYGRNITGLTFKSQRRMGKAIRRAKMMGIIPILSRPQIQAVSNYERS